MQLPTWAVVKTDDVNLTVEIVALRPDREAAEDEAAFHMQSVIHPYFEYQVVELVEGLIIRL